MDLLTSTDILAQNRGSLLRLPHVVTETRWGGKNMAYKRGRAPSLLREANRHAPLA